MQALVILAILNMLKTLKESVSFELLNLGELYRCSLHSPSTFLHVEILHNKERWRRLLGKKKVCIL